MTIQSHVAALKQHMEHLFPGKWVTGNDRQINLLTGLKQIDRSLARGVARQRITEWAGPVSSGKTTVLRAAIANWCAAGLNVVYIDTESKLIATDWAFVAPETAPGRFWVVRPPVDESNAGAGYKGADWKSARRRTGEESSGSERRLRAEEARERSTPEPAARPRRCPGAGSADGALIKEPAHARDRVPPPGTQDACAPPQPSSGRQDACAPPQPSPGRQDACAPPQPSPGRQDACAPPQPSSGRQDACAPPQPSSGRQDACAPPQPSPGRQDACAPPQPSPGRQDACAPPIGAVRHSVRSPNSADYIWITTQLLRTNAFDVVVLDLGGSASRLSSQLYARLQSSLSRSKAALIIIQDNDSSSSGWGCHARLNFQWISSVNYHPGINGIAAIAPAISCSIKKDGLVQTVELTSITSINDVPNRLFTHPQIPDRRTSKA